jgi:putative transposase
LIDNIAIELKHILSEICVDRNFKIHALEIMPDHVHLFLQTNPFIAPVEIVQTLKSISAMYLFTKFPALKKQKFWGSGLWSKGTFYSTVGYISEQTVKKYIESQKRHSSHETSS